MKTFKNYINEYKFNSDWHYAQFTYNNKKYWIYYDSPKWVDVIEDGKPDFEENIVRWPKHAFDSYIKRGAIVFKDKKPGYPKKKKKNPNEWINKALK